jgi:hypothetical protein
LPPSLDILLEQRFLRRKYKDPITGKDFDLLRQTPAAPGGAPAAAGRGASPSTGSSGITTAGGSSQPGVSSPTAPVMGAQNGIIGVASPSKDPSIRIYNGRTHYNEWQFVYVVQAQAPGAAGGPGGAQRGGPGGQGQPPGGQPGIGGRDGGRGAQGGRGGNTSPFGRGAGSSPFGGGTSPFGGGPSTPPSPARPR